MKTMFWDKLGKSFFTADSSKRSGSPRRGSMVSGGFAALVAAASLGGLNPGNAVEPAFDDVPSYIANAPTSIAMLVQAEDETQNAAEAAAETENDRTLRGALEMLSEDGGLEFSEETSVDPVQEVANRSIFADRQTSLKDGRFLLPPIEALTTSTKAIGNGEVPLGFRQGEVSPLIRLPESGTDRGVAWQWNSYRWAAANTFSHPLYFEDRMLERHGHQRYPHFQPFVSGGRFVAQAFMLSYLGAISPPSECQYTLGYYRAGSCVPALKQRPPFQRKAAAAQATAIGVGLAILP